jgi:hypothetical protein
MMDPLSLLSEHAFMHKSDWRGGGAGWGVGLFLLKVLHVLLDDLATIS